MKHRMPVPTAFLILFSSLFSTSSAASAFQADVKGNPKPWTHTNFPDDRSQFTFAVVGDRTGGMRPGIFADAVEKLNLLQPDFVMSVGDLISGYSEDEAKIEAEWDEFDSLVNRLDMPFFYVQGNHDISNKFMQEFYEKRRGRRYYHFVYKNNLFLILDSQEPLTAHRGKAIYDEQFEYTKEVLKKNRKVHCTYVFYHQPMHPTEESGRWSDLVDLLAKRKSVLFAGHWHTANKAVDGNITAYRLATTGGGTNLDGPVFGSMDHIMWITATPEGPIASNIMLDGILSDDVVDPVVAKCHKEIMEQSPVTVDPLDLREEERGKRDIAVRIVNPTESPMRIRLTPEAHPLITGSVSRTWLTVSPGEEKILENTLTFLTFADGKTLPPAVLNYAVSFKDKNGRRHERQSQAVIPIVQKWTVSRQKKSITVDGNLSEWGKLAVTCPEPSQMDFSPETWHGPEDVSMDFDVRYDNAFLFVGLRVRDDSVVVSNGDTAKAKPWFQDGAEIRIDARPDSVRSVCRGKGENKDFLMLGLCPGKTRESTVVVSPEFLPEGTEYACVQNGEGYTIEAAIPIEYVHKHQGTDWDGIRMNVNIGDFDGVVADRADAAQFQWRPDWRSKNTYTGSGMFVRD